MDISLVKVMRRHVLPQVQFQTGLQIQTKEKQTNKQNPNLSSPRHASFRLDTSTATLSQSSMLHDLSSPTSGNFLLVDFMNGSWERYDSTRFGCNSRVKNSSVKYAFFSCRWDFLSAFCVFFLQINISQNFTVWSWEYSCENTFFTTMQ